MATIRTLIFVLASIAVAVLTLGALFPLPSRQGIEAVDATAATRIGAAVLQAQSAHQGKSGVIPLAGRGAAFAARMLLARTAAQSLDV